ncbi:NifB/NifX family molybdenum-iron cluster-binding protein [Azospirillum picis]|uniref:Fe-Mo cluster-binding NifX family protein n=1 Tax=Azospirillum picis TaxID=488438 RepID=A0ABU0MDY2_9PROT|nr:NifB/NifX family molybdenum-iron cluster-binding protein [Azospirillum picis]MBP2297513.1 putative Fe-Mo cluster-binding NifX family protein [Azospirillum picis]MDQ0531464.1 putative Fe-Mo cluster-binding NifX family protein [Azospirillum picis]
MMFAVGTKDFKTIATHGGRTRRFLVYRAAAGAEPVETGRIELGEGEVLHLCGDGRPHPIDVAQVVITGSSGAGFLAHMRRRGIEPVTTMESDPVQAIRYWFAGVVRPAPEPEHPHEHHDGDGQP